MEINLFKALYDLKTNEKVEPNTVVMVNRRTLGFFPHLHIPNILLVDISHRDFAKYRMAYEAIQVSLHEFEGAGNTVKYSTINLDTESAYHTAVNKLVQTIKK